MLLSRFLSSSAAQPKINEDPNAKIRADYPTPGGYSTQANERVTINAAQSIATAYRAKNIISDDVAKMPFQMIMRNGRSIEQVAPDSISRNMAYLMQVSPNQWGWTPFQFKKSIIEWQLFYGNAYIWKPPVSPAQLFILPASKTMPVFDLTGGLWYKHTFTNGKTEYIPAVEILHLLINPDETGVMGRGVITFARETLGKQLGAYKVQSKMYAQGMTAAAIIQMQGLLDKDGRQKIRDAYAEAMSGSDNAFKLAVMDSAVVKFEPVQMKLTDSQFLEQINATNEDIANFFGLPLHMLNSGKQAYNSNEQRYLEYLQTTLDSYLVPMEEGARIRWLSNAEQGSTYFKFVRDSLMRMDAKTRAETIAINVQNALMTPSEGREKQDLSGYEEGDNFFITSNVQPVRNMLNNTPKPIIQIKGE